MPAQPFAPKALVVLLLAGLCACQCTPPPVEDDAGLPEDDGGLPDAGDVDAGVPCTPVVTGMLVQKSVTLCRGPYELIAGPDQAVVNVSGDDVTVTCQDTFISNPTMPESVGHPNAGFSVVGGRNVTLRGCSVHGYRYGVRAKGTVGLVLEDMNLDDNFTDPKAQWVQDSVQGGGVRLEQVDGGRVTNCTLRRNWNAIELRQTRGVVVSNVKADHCSNTGATLVDSHENELADSDFSWAIRGDQLAYPSRWYGHITFDSAGIIVDAASSKNRFLRNDTRYGGDGIFLRSVIGACAENNLIQGNDTSFSPNNALECWCDGNRFIDNIASDSNYGIWLGGTDQGLVQGNWVERNRVDGISIQIGEDRHSVITGNVIRNNGWTNWSTWRRGTGILLTGRELQAWTSLNPNSCLALGAVCSEAGQCCSGKCEGPPNATHYCVRSRLANSSHVLIEGNEIGDNALEDVIIRATSGVTLLSNCTPDGGEPRVNTAIEANFVSKPAGCQKVSTPAPTAALTVPTSVPMLSTVTLDATGSQSDAGLPLSYQWLVQPIGLNFVPSVLPTPLLAREGSASEQLVLTRAGIFDVDVTVHDGNRGALAWSTIIVPPPEPQLDLSASLWTYACDIDPSCTTSFDNNSPGIVGGKSVHARTNAPYEFSFVYPASKNLGRDLSNPGSWVGFFVRANNPNGGGWQIPSPAVVVGTSTGTLRYDPEQTILPTNPAEWTWVEIPLAGSNGWTRSGCGSLAQVNWVEIHADTWDWNPVDLWIDRLWMYAAPAPDGGDSDGGASAACMPDGGSSDGGSSDGGISDGGPADAGDIDAGDIDAGDVDAGSPDAG